MAMSIINTFTNLETEFQNVQKSLNDIDHNIKKITGKDPRTFENNNRNRSRKAFRSETKFFASKRKILDLNNDDESVSKRSLFSQVVSTSWENKHRTQVLEEQKNDKKSLIRNKRMFGLIQGTLEKFKNEESQRKDLHKRAEIEKKLDQAAYEEQEEIEKKRETLFRERKNRRIQMRCLEQKLQLVAIHKEWEESQQFVGNYIQTKAKPHIFYMPVQHNFETLKRSQETKDKFRIILAEKRAKMQKELNEIDELYKKDDDEEIKYNDENSNGHVSINVPSKDTNNNELKKNITENNEKVTDKIENKESVKNGQQQQQQQQIKPIEEIEKDFEPIYD